MSKLCICVFESLVLKEDFERWKRTCLSILPVNHVIEKQKFKLTLSGERCDYEIWKPWNYYASIDTCFNHHGYSRPLSIEELKNFTYYDLLNLLYNIYSEDIEDDI